MEPEPLLKGPKVEPPPRAVTMVAMDFDGKLRRPEGWAEVAALELMGLAPEEREPADAVVLERRRILDEFVAGNIDLLTKFGNAQGATSKREILPLLVEAMTKLRPLREKGPLRDAVRSSLPEARRAEYDRLLGEYDRAVIAEAKRSPEKKGAIGARIEENVRALTKEIELAYARVQRSGELHYRYFTLGMTLTPEQESKIRDVCRDFMATAGEEATKAQYADLYFKILRHLTPEQQTQLAKKVNPRK
jgi:hypothetical protein